MERFTYAQLTTCSSQHLSSSVSRQQTPRGATPPAHQSQPRYSTTTTQQSALASTVSLQRNSARTRPSLGCRQVQRRTASGSSTISPRLASHQQVQSRSALTTLLPSSRLTPIAPPLDRVTTCAASPSFKGTRKRSSSTPCTQQPTRCLRMPSASGPPLPSTRCLARTGSTLLLRSRPSRSESYLPIMTDQLQSHVHAVREL